MKTTSIGEALLARLEEQLVDHYGEDYDTPVPGWKRYPQAGRCYGPREGCLNEDSPLYHDDTLLGIINLYFEYFAVIRDEVEDICHIAMPEWIRIAVEPSYEDTSNVVIYMDKAWRVVFNYTAKAWNFHWPSPAEMAKQMEEDYQAMLKEVKRA